MRVLVTGASGLLGRAVFAAFEASSHDVKGTAFSRASDRLVKLDLNDHEAVRCLLEDFKPQIVVHCAAERRPDAVEASPEAARRLNVQSTSYLASLAVTLSFTLIYISTDYVFPGSPPSEQGYDVDDEPEPTNLYGHTKRDGEKVVLEAREKQGAKGTVLRVPVLYGPATANSESAINVLLDVVRSSASKTKKAKMDDWATRYPTHVGDIARVLVDLADLSTRQGLPPILHFSSQTLFTKYTISRLFASLHTPPLDLDPEWFVRDAEGPKPGETVRPRDCHLSNAELDKLGIDTTATDFEGWFKEAIQNGNA
ncbi:hypothetical protein JCM10212_001609 [Sporobolomyces blumeae]